MSNMPESFSKEVTIVNELGLHARSAAKIAGISQKAKAEVRIVRDGTAVDAKSIIDMLTLACGKGSRIRVEIDSASDMNILKKIVSLVESGFGE